MSSSLPREYTPLLGSGLHPMGWGELRERCVAAFPLSATRPRIMAGLEEVTARLARAGIAGRFWIDGSFLTEKIDPADVDLVLCVASDLLDGLAPEQEDALLWYTDRDRHSTHFCDSYIMAEFRKDHPLHSEGQSRREYWMRQFGLSRGSEPKGIAVVELVGGET